MSALRLDIYAPGDDYDPEIEDLVTGTGVVARPTGSYAAGGNPEYEFTGPAAQLGVIAARYVDDDDELGVTLNRIELDPRDERVDPEMARTLARTLAGS